MRRAQNTHAYVNAAFLVKANQLDKFRVEQKPNILFGGINENFVNIFRSIFYTALITSTYHSLWSVLYCRYCTVLYLLSVQYEYVPTYG